MQAIPRLQCTRVSDSATKQGVGLYFCVRIHDWDCFRSARRTITASLLAPCYTMHDAARVVLVSTSFRDRVCEVQLPSCAAAVYVS